MAYTLGDPFRPLRLVLRINSLLVGIGLGLLLWITPQPLLFGWGIYSGGVLWPLRLAGATQVALGIFFFLMASQDYLSKPTLLVTVLINSILALVLLSAYLRQELTALSGFGQLLFILIFFVYLVGAVAPLRYIRG